jgi:hypothetical protein
LACTPGFTADSSTLYPFPFATCGVVPGLEASDEAKRDLTLPAAIGPGDTYAFSAQVNTGGGSYRIYGATEECGAVGELLDTVDVASGTQVLCHEVTPVSGSYTHLIWVWGAATQQGDTTFCEDGTCPVR